MKNPAKAKELYDGACEVAQKRAKYGKVESMASLCAKAGK